MSSCTEVFEDMSSVAILSWRARGKRRPYASNQLRKPAADKDADHNYSRAMSFFESLLVLLLVAIVLLQISRRLSVPYPSMLALAGAAVALVPGMPYISLDPHTALALFIAPALLDAAFDFPLGTARRFWVPLLVFAIGGVCATAAAVAFAGWAFAGLPIAAALVLGAIVAPPDAAAATAVLSSMSIPRTTDTVLRGESLFNDAAALLIFDARFRYNRPAVSTRASRCIFPSPCPAACCSASLPPGWSGISCVSSPARSAASSCNSSRPSFCGSWPNGLACRRCLPSSPSR
jgi:hypothetical protein